MPKQLISLIGAALCAGVLILGVVVGVAPLVTEALATSAQAAQVSQSNVVYAQQLAALEQQEERLDEITASVEGLREGISADPQLDDVFELIADAAQTSGVSVETITAGEVIPFVERTSAVGFEESAASAAAAAETPAEPDSSTQPASEGTSGSSPSGRSQIDFTIRVDATNMAQAVAFLDALRSGSRLFSTIDTLVSTTGVAIDVDVTGLAYIYGED